MWILPPQLLSAYAPVTGGLNSESKELLAAAAESSLLWRSKPSRSKTWLRKFQADTFPLLQSGAICEPSQQKSFTEWWISCVGDTHASEQEQWFSLGKDTDPSKLFLLEIPFLLIKDDGEKLPPICVEQIFLSEKFTLEACMASSQPTSTHSSPERKASSGIMGSGDTKEFSTKPNGCPPKTLPNYMSVRFFRPNVEIADRLTSGGLLEDIWLMGGSNAPLRRGVRGGLTSESVNTKRNCLKPNFAKPDSPHAVQNSEPPSDSSSPENTSTNSCSNSVDMLTENSCQGLFTIFQKKKPGRSLTDISQAMVIKPITQRAKENTAVSQQLVNHSLMALLYWPNAPTEWWLESVSMKVNLQLSSKEERLTSVPYGSSLSLSATVRPLSKVIMDGSLSVNPSLVAMELSSISPLKKMSPILLTEPLSITANRFLMLANEKEPKTLATSGLTSPGQLTLFGPDGSSSKTSKDTSRSDSGKSLPIWLTSDTGWKTALANQRGEYSRRLKSARLTRESGSSSWRTPNTMDCLDPKSQEALAHELEHRPGRSEPGNLRDQVACREGIRTWPTPSQRDYKGGRLRNGKVSMDTLDVAIQAYSSNGLRAPENLSTNGSRPESLNPDPKAPSTKTWRTPHASDGEGGVMEMREGANGHYKLRDHVVHVEKNWPTPRTITGGAESGERKKELGRLNSGGSDLQAEVKNWSTPVASERSGRNPNTGKGEGLQRQSREAEGNLKAVLNPRWVETLQGLPIGWCQPTAVLTNCGFWEMVSCRSKRQKPS